MTLPPSPLNPIAAIPAFAPKASGSIIRWLAEGLPHPKNFRPCFSKKSVLTNPNAPIPKTAVSCAAGISLPGNCLLPTANRKLKKLLQTVKGGPAFEGHIDLGAEQSAAAAVVLYNGNAGVAGGKGPAQQGIRFGTDAAAQQHQVDCLGFESGDGILVGVGAKGVPLRVVVDQAYHGLYDGFVAAGYEDLYLIHAANIRCGEGFLVGGV
ncbi:MAG TPA: hypothetical protein VK668_24025 [Mucilaginibacter sp.]|nr:hypothetical protein [Mucilaginibacter sp.]